ncbi:MAG TPA: serine hydrolase domain-containing protein [Vicinamibacterales bacterium]|jgi:CubicO group peptidase (beta-lactamase class C family)|nr:serine hydrolase domain-containing protein [Vicinamibacterales bacterium]
MARGARLATQAVMCKTTRSLPQRSLSTVLWLCLTAAGAAAVDPAAAPGLPAARARTIERYVKDAMRSARIPGLALAIVDGDRLVYLRGFGRADPSGRPVTPQTPFCIGSVTKSFTALAIMQLVDAGKVELDAPLRRYLPWFRVADPVASGRITVRQLLTMTSGLPELYDVQRWRTEDRHAIERAVRRLATEDLARPIGAFGYSNSNYQALGLVVQAVSGLSYEDYVTRRIFEPLDMRNSFAVHDDALRDGLATGHRWWFGVPVSYVQADNRAELPAGYLYASVEDIGHYLIAQLNGGRYEGRHVLSDAGMAALHAEPPSGAYGMGWESIRVGGHRLINHDGGTANFQTSAFFDDDARVGVFLAANVIDALDALSSPHGASRLDGSTLRGMAMNVLSLAANRPWPPQGPGRRRVILIFDATILVLTLALAAGLIGMPGRRRTGSVRTPRRYVAAALACFVVPALLAYLVVEVPAWGVLVEFQPDLSIWAGAVAIVLLVRGAIDLEAARRARRAATA